MRVTDEMVDAAARAYSDAALGGRVLPWAPHMCAALGEDK